MGEYDFHSRCFCYFGMDNDLVEKNHYLRYNFLQIFLNNHLVLFPADYLVKQNSESTKVSTLSNKFFTSISFTVSQNCLTITAKYTSEKTNNSKKYEKKRFYLTGLNYESTNMLTKKICS